MYIPNQTAFTAAEKVILDTVLQVKTMLTGMSAGTKIETENGWRNVQDLRAGDRVFTYDGGLRELIGMEHNVVSAALGHSLVHVPGGVLSNCDDTYVAPDQLLLLESHFVERETGRPNVLVQARDLCGLGGISTVPVENQTQLFAPIFAQQEIVWANSGMLFHSANATSNFFAQPGKSQVQAILQDMFADHDDLMPLAA